MFSFYSLRRNSADNADAVHMPADNDSANNDSANNINDGNKYNKSSDDDLSSKWRLVKLECLGDVFAQGKLRHVRQNVSYTHVQVFE
jgi:hypothetical protein